MHRQ